MSATEPTLAEVIREALQEHGSLLFECEMERSDKIPADVHDHIAAAVTAWASSDAAVERLAEHYATEDGINWSVIAKSPTYQEDDPDGYWTGANTYRKRARAAVAALLGARD